MDTKEVTAKKPTWAADDIAIKVVKSGTLSHEHLTMEAGARGHQYQASTRLYDALAMSYNQAEPGDMLMVALPNRPSTSNLRKTFGDRGLKECDFRLFRPTVDEQGRRCPQDKRPLVLQRITDQKMRIVQQSLAALAEIMAKEAAQRGTSYNFAQPENPVNPGTA